MIKLNYTKSDEWDRQEKERVYDIDFKGEHIHELENNHCKLCGKTREQILKDRY